MWLKKVAKNQYEMYIPLKKNWTTLEQFHTFLKQFERKYRLFEPGYYNVLVITNAMGNQFFIEKIEEYVYKKDVDLRILVLKKPFYIKSSMASVFLENIFYYQGYFYGKSDQLSSKIWVYEFIEIIQEEAYKKAMEKGISIKKGRDISSL